MKLASAIVLAQAAQNPGSGLLCVVLIGLLFYLLPGAIAILRGHHNAFAILLLNVLLGWTFVGWAVALVWAFTVVERRD
ncbi:MAG: superinfection immunity protein [Planctomycetota bacterium]